MKALKHLVLAAILAFTACQAGAQNKGGVLLSSAARTATTVNSADIVNAAGKFVHVIIDITARTTGTFTFTIQGKDPASGKYYTVLASTALNSTGTTVLKVGPGLPASGNVSANDVLPMVWRVNMAGASTPIATYSVGYMVMQ